MKKYCYGFFLIASIAINVFLGINLYCVDRVEHGENKLMLQDVDLGWSNKAAAEAEAVAAMPCSGHGRAFVDGVISEDGRLICECYDCYSGNDCSVYTPFGCPADAKSGDPIFMEPFWMQNAENSTVVISGWHRLGYWYDNGDTMSIELEKHIRQLHSVVGNAVTEGRYVVFGIGAMQLLSAAIYALASENTSSPSNVLATIPYYPMFEHQTMFFNGKTFNFEGDTKTWLSRNDTDGKDVIEFVTFPNNPDGALTEPVLEGKTIYDQAYYWPHYTPIPHPSDEEVMIFSMSKFTGHAGTRFGWAVIKDESVHKKFLQYIQFADLGISKDTQLRVLKLLKVVLEGDGKSLFKYGHNKMSDRWDKLISIFTKSKRFSLQQRQPSHCNFFNETRLPTPAYAWVKCERPEDLDCGAILLAGKIIGSPGSNFRDEDRYTRLNILMSEGDFELLLQRLTELVSLENDSIQTM